MIPTYSVLVGVGAETTSEVIATTTLLRKQVPNLRAHIVKATNPMVLLTSTVLHPHAPSMDILSSSRAFFCGAQHRPRGDRRMQ